MLPLVLGLVLFAGLAVLVGLALRRRKARRAGSGIVQTAGDLARVQRMDSLRARRGRRSKPVAKWQWPGSAAALALLAAFLAFPACGLKATDIAAQTLDVVDQAQIEANKQFAGFYHLHVHAIRFAHESAAEKQAELDAFDQVADKVGAALDGLAHALQVASSTIAAVVKGEQGESVLASVVGAVYAAILAFREAATLAGFSFSGLAQLLALVPK